jgi:hypothetical protein
LDFTVKLVNHQMGLPVDVLCMNPFSLTSSHFNARMDNQASIWSTSWAHHSVQKKSGSASARGGTGNDAQMQQVHLGFPY